MFYAGCKLLRLSLRFSFVLEVDSWWSDEVGRLCAVGLTDGQVIFYYSDGLRYFTQVECRNRYGKDKKGRKVTGISFIKKKKKQYMVVTTNDSRIRLISMDTFGIVAKLKGNENRSMQLQAALTSDQQYIACGSDDGKMYSL